LVKKVERNKDRRKERIKDEENKIEKEIMKYKK
jgi:hypothetical protein